MNYATAARRAISAFNQLRGRVPASHSTGETIERTAEFRTLKVLESSGSSKGLSHVLFELEFCSKEGDNYRSVWIRVNSKESILDTNTIIKC